MSVCLSTDFYFTSSTEVFDDHRVGFDSDFVNCVTALRQVLLLVAYTQFFPLDGWPSHAKRRRVDLWSALRSARRPGGFGTVADSRDEC
jgi:hypothetical protein